MRVWRIGRADRPVWDGTGAALVGGRWNPMGRPVIYAADHYALALLEVLVHARIGAPPQSRYVQADIPDDIAVERIEPEDLPGWDAPDMDAARAAGARWLTEGRAAVLSVPSVVSPFDRNFAINPSHPEAARIVVSEPRPLVWEPRLAELVAR